MEKDYYDYIDNKIKKSINNWEIYQVRCGF